MQHELKTWPEHFEDVWNGDKTFELRKYDRRFSVGDTLVLREFDPQTGNYTGKVQHKTVSHILHGGMFGLKKGYVIMSLE